MKNYRRLFLALGLIIAPLSQAKPLITERIPEFSNSKVSVWKTIIYPTVKQKLTMHRHEYARIVVALTDGTLKVMTNKGQTHYLHLKKDKAYYFEKDAPNELHTDENLSSHPIKVMVIELKLS